MVAANPVVPQKSALRDDGSCPSSWTESFNCDNYKPQSSGCAMSIFFESKCAYPIEFAIRARLRNDEEAGFCNNPAHGKGDWCTRAWFSLDPGKANENQLLQTDNTIFYFWGKATDDTGRMGYYSGDADSADTNWYDTSTGEPCSKGSSATCRPFIQASPRCSQRGSDAFPTQWLPVAGGS